MSSGEGAQEKGLQAVVLGLHPAVGFSGLPSLRESQTVPIRVLGFGLRGHKTPASVPAKPEGWQRQGRLLSSAGAPCALKPGGTENACRHGRCLGCPSVNARCRLRAGLGLPYTFLPRLRSRRAQCCRAGGWPERGRMTCCSALPASGAFCVAVLPLRHLDGDAVRRRCLPSKAIRLRPLF